VVQCTISQCQHAFLLRVGEPHIERNFLVYGFS
jgi:hypothetical protein